MELISGGRIHIIKRRFHVYIITNIVNRKQYVGKSKGNSQKRWQKHVSNAFNSRSREYNTCLSRAIRRYSKENLTHRVIFQTDEEKKAFAKEKEFIQKLKTRAPYGYNLTDGGEGMSGFRWSNKARARRKGKGNPLYGKGCLVEGEKNGMYGKGYLIAGKKHGMYGRHRVSPMRGKHHSIETREKISKALQGKNHPKAKLTADQVRKIRELYSTGRYTQRQLADMFKVHQTTVNHILVHRSWSYLK